MISHHQHLKVGSLAWLKSGSPALRVMGIRDGEAWLAWWDGLEIRTVHASTACFTTQEPPGPFYASNEESCHD